MAFTVTTMALAVSAVEVPKLDAADELLVDWIAQDAGIGPGVNPLAGNLEDTCRRSLAKVGLGRGTNETWEAALARYRAFCLKRRTERLAPVAAMAPRWVYARHFVMGGSHYAYTEALTTAAREHCWANCGGGIYIAELTPAGLWRETPLVETKTGCYRDVDVSLDGKRILYSYKASEKGDDYHIYEMDLETRKVRQLTSSPGIADIEGCYLPDGRILFASTRCRQIVDCWFTEVSNFFRMDADGSNVYRLTFDQVHDTYPTLCDDGTVFYTRWEYNDRGQGFPQPLFRMAADGTGQRAFYGENSWYPTTLLHARMVGKGPLVFAIGTGHHTSHPGELLLIDVRQGREEGAGIYELEPLRPAQRVKEDAFRIHGRMAAYPYPVNERSVVLAFLPEGWPRSKHGHVSQYGTRNAEFGLYWTDVEGARELLVGRKGRVPCGRPVPIKARKVFPRPSSVPDESLTTGTVYVRDVYEGPSMAGVPRGTVKSMRVVELDYRRVGIGFTMHSGAGHKSLASTTPAIGDGSWDVKKVWGEVPVSERGSVAFEAPARVPLYFQLLDAKGRLVQTMRSWTVLQPGETASCVGCHEPPNLAPPMLSESKDVVQKGVLKRPERGFSFPRDIQPILDRRCVGCHNPKKEPYIPDFTTTPVPDPVAKRNWTQAYLSLTHARPTRVLRGEVLWLGESNHLDLNWINACSEPTLLPPYMRGSAVSRIFTHRLDRGHCPALTEAEKRTLACWVDLCVPFSGDYHEGAAWTPAEEAAWNLAERRHREQSTTYR